MRRFQLAPFTYLHRYKALLLPTLRLRARLGFAEPARVLSFGCSTGEECLSLQAAMPGATIHGCDIDEASLAVAQARCEPLGIECFLSDEAGVRARGPYDVIFANAVLCLHPGSMKLETLAEALPFGDVDAIVTMLVDSLTDGGILMLADSNYPVAGFSRYNRLVPVDIDTVAPYSDAVERFRAVERFNKDGTPFARRVGSGLKIVGARDLNWAEALLDRVFLKRAWRKPRRYRIEAKLLPSAETLESLGEATLYPADGNEATPDDMLRITAKTETRSIDATTTLSIVTSEVRAPDGELIRRTIAPEITSRDFLPDPSRRDFWEEQVTLLTGEAAEITVPSARAPRRKAVATVD